mgnify:CR=1 FL=1
MTQRRTFLTATAGTGLLAASGLAIGQAPVKAGFVYVSPIGDAGWTFQHDTGRKQMEQALAGKVQTQFIESVKEGPDAERVIRELAQSGHQVIFATSFGYMNYMERVAKQFPKTAFIHATGYKMGPNMGIYNARFYEGRYLTGVVAGSMSRSNVLGYVAAFPIPEVLQGINAFTRGARSVNPKAHTLTVVALSSPTSRRITRSAGTLASCNTGGKPNASNKVKPMPSNLLDLDLPIMARLKLTQRFQSNTQGSP